jgi:hypothetical protein
MDFFQTIELFFSFMAGSGLCAKTGRPFIYPE